MVKMKLETKVFVEKEFEVEFPIYRKFDLTEDSDNYSIIYSRVTRNGNKMIEASIHTRKSGFEIIIGIDNNYNFGRESIDYSLGLGIYKSSCEEYQKAKNKVIEVLEKI